MKSILAVEDSVAIRQLLCAVLGQGGYEVCLAEDGVDGLRQARSRHFDLVLTDLHMPGLDGLGLIRALRALPEYRALPILMLTTDTSSGQREAGRQAGASGWVLKPFDPQRLLQLIAKVLG